MKYRKLPIVIEAIQLTESTIIHTLEGDMTGNVGDWLITGVNGEQYPCKDEIFCKTYKSCDLEPPNEETVIMKVVHLGKAKSNFSFEEEYDA